MDRIIQSPGKYIQGADVLTRLGDYLKPLANRWLVVGDKFVLGFAEETLRQSFKKAELHAEIAPFGGECSQNEIDRLKKLADSADCLARCWASAAVKRWIPPKRWRISWTCRWPLRRPLPLPMRRAAPFPSFTPTAASSIAT